MFRWIQGLLGSGVVQKREVVGFIADYWAYCPDHYRWLLDEMKQRHDAPEHTRIVWNDDRTIGFDKNPGWMTCVRCGKKLVRYAYAFEQQPEAAC